MFKEKHTHKYKFGGLRYTDHEIPDSKKRYDAPWTERHYYECYFCEICLKTEYIPIDFIGSPNRIQLQNSTPHPQYEKIFDESIKQNGN